MGQFLIWFFFLVLLTIQGPTPIFSNSLSALLSLLTLVAGTLSLRRTAPTGFWSPAVVFLLVLGVFHLGLAPYWILQIRPSLARANDFIWFEGVIGGSALQLVTLGIAAYVTGALLAALLSYPRATLHALSDSSVSAAATKNNERRSPAFGLWGAAILTASLLAWFAITLDVGGIGIYASSYQNFLRLTAGTPLPYTYAGIGLGLSMTVIVPVATLFTRSSIALFCLFSLPAFFLGLRGEVLFPLFAALTIVAFRKRLPSMLVSAGAGIFLLTLINAAKQIRQLGVSNSDFEWQQASPLEALAELGSSLRVVATVVEWHFVSGEPFLEGRTYTVSLARLGEKLFTPSTRVSASEDFRLMNTEIYERAGAIGGSIIGEAYHNLSAVGVVVVLMAVGVMFGIFTSMKPTVSNLAVYAVVAAPMFNHIRNSFVPVIPSICIGLLMIWAISVLSRPFGKRPKPAPYPSPNTGPPYRTLL